ncbi:MAG: Bud site selection protein 20 [Tremellales sp. Tagirdzhanova-0007]|nr:MAG: Bud site selection protein 20 [Tremellales sp. Tagirdzhanova-0007]
MGRVRRSRTHNARRDVHRAARTRARVKDLDQIQTDLRPENKGKLELQPIDEDKPGLGQHYCVECARRRLKELREPAYTVGEAERAAGLGTDNRQRGVEEVDKRLEGMLGVIEGEQRI